MPNNGRRATPQEIAEFYEKLRAGTPEQKLEATAKYYRKSAASIRNQLKFWWPGERFVKEFRSEGPDRRRWDLPTDKLLTALNEHGSVAQTAKALKTTPITLTKCLTRKGIKQQWVATGSRS